MPSNPPGRVDPTPKFTAWNGCYSSSQDVTGDGIWRLPNDELTILIRTVLGVPTRRRRNNHLRRVTGYRLPSFNRHGELGKRRAEELPRASRSGGDGRSDAEDG